ncbi:CorA family divalent cation transporter [Phaeobacter sp. PT47_59]|uniref:CorA family divalent cation transporter n=1 Tax=Phaeobacter sp. PT47_59 TaxID=3029979 RepID=UPI00238043F8|nr:CorA family divalent cation transporter [Phaeobacter sp. PT47_59]MDE4174336.1 CorA family divalent cation transporter [Phaeobacter sp. PT47_59]
MPICAYDLWPDGNCRKAPDLKPTGRGSLRWLHFDLGDPELAGWIAEHLPPIPGRALTEQETRPRCDALGDGLILNLRGVNLNSGAAAAEMVSLRMWVTPKTIITVRKRKVFALDDIRQGCANGTGPGTVGRFLDQLIHGLALRARDVVLDLTAATETLEEQIDEGNLPADDALKTPRRDVLKLHRYMEPQRVALTRLQQLGDRIMTPEEQTDLREAVNLVTLSDEALTSLNHRLAVIQDHTDAELARKMSRNSYILSIVAAVFLPLGFVTGLFGVNVAGMPGLETPLAFAILCLALVALSAAMIVVLRWSRLF